MFFAPQVKIIFRQIRFYLPPGNRLVKKLNFEVQRLNPNFCA